jgi:hypothetical protein
MEDVLWLISTVNQKGGRMVIGDNEYNKHFHQMVAQGIICGLDHPIEWLIDYGRCTSIPYTDIPIVDEFTKLAGFDLYELVNCSKAKDEAEIQAWIDIHYSN